MTCILYSVYWNQILQSDLLIPLNGGHLSSEKVACGSKQGHFEKPGSKTDLNTMQDMCKALPACMGFFKAKMLHKTCEGIQSEGRHAVCSSSYSPKIPFKFIGHSLNMAAT